MLRVAIHLPLGADRELNFGARGRGGVLNLCMAVVLRPLTLAHLQCRDGPRWIFTDQADIACTKREAPGGVRRVARRMSCILLRTTGGADSRASCVLSCYRTTAFICFLGCVATSRNMKGQERGRDWTFGHPRDRCWYKGFEHLVNES